MPRLGGRESLRLFKRHCLGELIVEGDSTNFVIRAGKIETTEITANLEQDLSFWLHLFLFHFLMLNHAANLLAKQKGALGVNGGMMRLNLFFACIVTLLMGWFVNLTLLWCCSFISFSILFFLLVPWLKPTTFKS